MDFVTKYDPNERLRERSYQVHNYWKSIEAHTGSWDICMEQPCVGDREMIEQMQNRVEEMKRDIFGGTEMGQSSGDPAHDSQPGVHMHRTVFAVDENGHPVDIPPQFRKFLDQMGFGVGGQS